MGHLLPLILAVIAYLISAYRKNEKKRQAELTKQQQAQPQSNTPVKPAYETRKPQPDLFKEMFGDKPLPKLKQYTQPKQQKKPYIKPVKIPVPVTEEAIVEAREAQPDIHAESLRQANDAYALSTDLESYVFNPRDAVIASIILQRPEY